MTGPDPTRQEVLRRKAGTALLVAFRRLPAPVKRGLVRRGTPHYTVGAVCAIEHEGEVLLLWQPHREGWSLPGGLVQRGESPEEAVAREVLEEVGLRIDPGEPVAYGVHPDSQAVDVVFRIVVAERPSTALSTEARKATWWSLDELERADRETRQIIDLLATIGRDPRPGRLLDDASAAGHS